MGDESKILKCTKAQTKYYGVCVCNCDLIKLNFSIKYYQALLNMDRNMILCIMWDGTYLHMYLNNDKNVHMY